MSYNEEYANKAGYINFYNNETFKKALSSLSFINKGLVEEDHNKKDVKKISRSIAYGKKKFKKVYNVDGGFTIVSLGRKTSIAFIKIGFISFDMDKLESLKGLSTVSSKDLNSTKEEKTLEFCVPISNIRAKSGEKGYLYTIRETLKRYNLFETLLWVLNEGYRTGDNSFTEESALRLLDKEWIIGIDFGREDLPNRISSIMGFFEQLLLLQKFKEKVELGEEENYFFIKDGSLSFSRKPGSIVREKMITLFDTLLSKGRDFYFIGLEKSWRLIDFVEENKKHIEKESFIPINDDFIRNEFLYDTFYNLYYASKVIINLKGHRFIANNAYSFRDNDFKEIRSLENLYNIIGVLESIKTSCYKDATLSIVHVNRLATISQSSQEKLRKLVFDNIKG